MTVFFRCNFRLEVASDVISGANVGLVGMDVAVKFGDSIPNGSRDIQQRSHRMVHFRPFFNFDNCQPEVVIDVISSMVNQDVVMDYVPSLEFLG